MYIVGMSANILNYSKASAQACPPWMRLRRMAKPFLVFGWMLITWAGNVLHSLLPEMLQPEGHSPTDSLTCLLDLTVHHQPPQLLFNCIINQLVLGGCCGFSIRDLWPPNPNSSTSVFVFLSFHSFTAPIRSVPGPVRDATDKNTSSALGGIPTVGRVWKLFLFQMVNPCTQVWRWCYRDSMGIGPKKVCELWIYT